MCVSVSVLACAWVCVCVPVPKGWCNFITYGVVSFHFVLLDIGPPHLFFSLKGKLRQKSKFHQL